MRTRVGFRDEFFMHAKKEEEEGNFLWAIRSWNLLEQRIDSSRMVPMNLLAALQFKCTFLPARDLFQLFPAEASSPLRAAQNNRELWGRAHEALERRGRNGVTGNVRDIFRDDSVEREVAGLAEKISKG